MTGEVRGEYNGADRFKYVSERRRDMADRNAVMQIYRRESRQKLNTVVLSFDEGWRGKQKAVEAVLEGEGFTAVLGAELPGLQREHTIILTDSAARAGRFQGKGFVCVGCAEAGRGFFQGAELVLEEPEALELPYMEEHLCRMLGEAVWVGETSRLILKEISPDEAGILREISLACEARFLHDPGEDSFFEEQRLQAYIREAYRLYGYGMWSVLLKEREEPAEGDALQNVQSAAKTKAAVPGTVIGCCGLSHVLWEDGITRVELQYILGEKYRGRGYGYEMCRKALELARERAGCEKVWLRVHPDNVPSLGLARKLGFCREEIKSRHNELLFSCRFA